MKFAEIRYLFTSFLISLKICIKYGYLQVMLISGIFVAKYLYSKSRFLVNYILLRYVYKNAKKILKIGWFAEKISNLKDLAWIR